MNELDGLLEARIRESENLFQQEMNGLIRNLGAPGSLDLSPAFLRTILLNQIVIMKVLDNYIADK